MRKIISLLSNLWIISSTSLTVVACYKNVYKKPQLEDIASIESNLQEILDSKNNEGWKREDLQAKIDARYEGILVVDDEALLVHAFVKEMRPFTKTWIFIGEGTKNNDFTYEKSIQLDHNWNIDFADLSSLQDVIFQASEIELGFKKPEALSVLNEAIQKAEEYVLTDPKIEKQSEVDDQTQTLLAAIETFNNSNNRPAETQKLEQAILDADEIKIGYKTDKAFTDLKIAIQIAKDFLIGCPTIDQQQVETHFTKLEAAITAFNNSNNRPAEIAKWNNLINQANNLELGHKTQQAFDDLKAAIAIVNQFLATKPTVDQQTVVDQHFTELSKAIDDFNSSENRIADVELLNQTIQIAQDIQQGYKTDKAFQILQDALKVAKDFMLITPTTDQQTEVDEHWAILSKAIDDFNNSKNQLADVELLEQKIIEAGLIEQGDKTDEAFEILTTTINDADSFVKSKPTIDMQEQVKTHLNNLEEAIVNFHNSKNRSANVELLENKISEAVEIKIGVKTVNAFQTLRAAIGVAIAYFKTQPTIDQQVEVDRQLAILTAAIQTFNESEEDIVDSQTWYIDPSGREKKTHGSAPWGTKEITNVGWNNKGRAYKMPSTIEKVPNHISSRITNMEELFSGADKFNDDISQWNTSNVTNMSGMFRNASSFDQDLKTNGNAWNVAKADTMFEMFHNATAFNGDISNWNVSQVTTMGMMFQNARNFNQKIKRNGDVWNTWKVQNMIYMFNGASSFNQNISNWNVGKVINHASFSTNSKWLKEHQPQWKK
ncbi:BspA family leucine-rich repeat surface protein [Williamsoniiplasma lucivorax]|uniref:Lipoprotein n=1 Tax=Williamsoniiplasma lucivorax TaxID=209274 RepID=A0A2S5RA66_9MOLU|nr:BspA family leucine-rich repeat surface protein [Williamsoniiplasma lucivorax]PPE04082.1 hypothetical protein ELUCI_v1c08620 [Williamsoniiplasma lucivorax]